MRRALAATLAFAIVIKPTWASEEYYVVQPGETLSEIAKAILGGPVYSKKKGSLWKLLELNPKFIKNKDFVREGTKIRVPRKKEKAVIAPPVELAPTPPTVATPTLAPEKAPEETPEEAPKKPFFRGPKEFDLTGRLDASMLASTIVTTGAKAKLLSILHYGARANLVWGILDESALDFALNGSRLHFVKPSGGTLLTDSFTRYGFNLGYRWYFAERSWVGGGIFNNQVPMISSDENGVLSVRAATVFGANIATDIYFINLFGLVDYGITLAFNQTLPRTTDSYSIKSNWSFQGVGYLERKMFENAFIRATAGFSFENENTIEVRQYHIDVNTELSFRYVFPENVKSDQSKLN